ncbi:MAG: Crp/Fnr family transcriptional regulator [Myxococcales bacterium]|nr:Crp/Fnr family transcriptional regulator [Myxococcales bacterium]
MRTIIEKVIFLQNVDVFSHVLTEQLAYVAAIAEEVVWDRDQKIYAEDDPSDAMYLVLEGRVRLHRGEQTVTEAGPKEAFGTWALFDDEPRVAAATAVERTEALRVARSDFLDVLADNVRVTEGILKAMVRRLRALGRVVRNP